MLRARSRSTENALALLRMNAQPAVRAATGRDAPAIRALLEACALPTTDLMTARPEFMVAWDGPVLAGVGGVQRFGGVGLLRSVAVPADRRRSGLGFALVRAVEQQARESGISQLVLLTQTAQPFFERQGYRVIERASAPESIQASDEFRSLCPQSAACMSKNFK